MSWGGSRCRLALIKSGAHFSSPSSRIALSSSAHQSICLHRSLSAACLPFCKSLSVKYIDAVYLTCDIAVREIVSFELSRPCWRHCQWLVRRLCISSSTACGLIGSILDDSIWRLRNNQCTGLPSCPERGIQRKCLLCPPCWRLRL